MKRELDRFQKIVLCLTGGMAAVFLICYIFAAQREYYDYNGHLFKVEHRNETDVYTGEINGTDVTMKVNRSAQTFSVNSNGNESEPFTVRVNEKMPYEKDGSVTIMKISIYDGLTRISEGTAALGNTDRMAFYYPEEVKNLQLLTRVPADNGYEVIIYDGKEIYTGPSPNYMLQMMFMDKFTFSSVSWFMFGLALVICVINVLFICYRNALYNNRIIPLWVENYDGTFKERDYNEVRPDRSYRLTSGIINILLILVAFIVFWIGVI